jgi:hypothetical protein
VPLAGAVYLVCGAAGLGARGGVTTDDLLPAEPYLTVCRLLMLVLTADLVVLFAAVYGYAPADRKTCGLAAFGFALVFAAVAGVNTFLLVTVARPSRSDPAWAWLFSFRWPSVNLALNLFAWGPVLGLALLFAAPVFRGAGRLHAAARAGLGLGGLLCTGNVLCFALDDVRFSALGIAGYDLVLPVVCILLAVLFGRSEVSGASSGETPAGRVVVPATEGAQPRLMWTQPVAADGRRGDRSLP